jgi:hypothetical protein
MIVGSARTRAQRPGIANLGCEADAAHPKMHIAAYPLAFDLVCFVADAQRQNVRPRQNRVNRDFPAI